jgi:hypothetical protein
MEKQKQETHYNSPVGIKDGEIYFLNYTFHHSDGCKGATGFSLRPITKDEVDERNEYKNVKEYVRELWQIAVNDGNYEGSLEDYADDYIYDIDIDENDGDRACFIGHDDSYSEHYGEARKYFDGAYTFELGSGGRCFSSDDKWDKVINQELLNFIKKSESK